MSSHNDYVMTLQQFVKILCEQIKTWSEQDKADLRESILESNARGGAGEERTAAENGSRDRQDKLTKRRLLADTAVLC